MNYYTVNAIIDKDIKKYELKKKAILIYNPYLIHININQMIKKLKKYYYVGEKKTVNTFQGSIQYYELIKK